MCIHVRGGGVCVMYRAGGRWVGVEFYQSGELGRRDESDVDGERV